MPSAQRWPRKDVLGIRAVTKMSAMRGVVHVGILLGPILIIRVSTLPSRRLDGIEEGSLLEMRVCSPCFDCFSTEQDEDPYTAQLVNVMLCRPDRPV